MCQTAFFHFFSAQLFMSELLLPLGALFLLVQLNCRRSFVHSLALPAARSSICMLNRSLRLSQIAHGRLLLSSQLKKWMEGRRENGHTLLSPPPPDRWWHAGQVRSFETSTTFQSASQTIVRPFECLLACSMFRVCISSCRRRRRRLNSCLCRPSARVKRERERESG